MWKNFQPAYRDPGWKNRGFGNRANPPSHMNTSIFFKGFRGEARSRKRGPNNAIRVFAAEREFRAFRLLN